MTDHPIIFSAPMIRALLDGRKTQTRRLAERNTKHYEGPSPWCAVKPGDRLWVKERGWRSSSGKGDAFYPFADNKAHERGQSLQGYKAIPSIHMPRWASRLTLIVTATKIERLHALSERDAEAEGVDGEISFTAQYTEDRHYYSRGFAKLWDELHGADSWASNPEIVALTFRVERRNIDEIREAA